MAAVQHIVKWIKRKSGSKNDTHSAPLVSNSALNRSLPAIPDIAAETMDSRINSEHAESVSNFYEEITPVDNLFIDGSIKDRLQSLDIDLTKAREIGSYLIVPIKYQGRCYNQQPGILNSHIKSDNNDQCDFNNVNTCRKCVNEHTAVKIGEDDFNNDGDITSRSGTSRSCRRKCRKDGAKFRHGTVANCFRGNIDKGTCRYNENEEIYSSIPSDLEQQLLQADDRYLGERSGRSLPRNALSILALPNHVRSQINKAFSSPDQRADIDTSDTLPHQETQSQSKDFSAETSTRCCFEDESCDSDEENMCCHGDPDYTYYLDKVKHHLLLKEEVKKIVHDDDDVIISSDDCNTTTSTVYDSTSMSTTSGQSVASGDSGNYTDTALDLSDDCCVCYEQHTCNLNSESVKDQVYPHKHVLKKSNEKNVRFKLDDNDIEFNETQDGGGINADDGKFSCRVTDYVLPPEKDRLSCRATTSNITQLLILRNQNKMKSKIDNDTPARFETDIVNKNRNRLLREMTRVNNDRQFLVL